MCTISTGLRAAGETPFLVIQFRNMAYESWGRYPRVRQVALPLYRASEPLPPTSLTVLPYGQGRSYGDSCLNADNAVLPTAALDRFLAFDEHTGLLRCEAGVTLAEILEVFVPRGWFLPVSPGTQFVSVGGAIANDIHGKNHHRAGSFGNHVPRFELLRSDGSRRICSADENREWYEATIGGLGLTGLITWAELTLKPVPTAGIDQEIVRFGGVAEFLELSRSSEGRFEYSVAWVDTLAGRSIGRGLFFQGNHATPDVWAERQRPSRRRLSVPCELPGFTLSALSLRAFNAAFYRKQLRRVKRNVVHYEPFFYPLDSIGRWNRIYGRRGLLQYQCVFPESDGAAVLEEMLRLVARESDGSFLTVLKKFGSIPSRGLLSFPREGITLCLDFPNSGPRLFALLDRLDALVRAAKGAVYPAKDARMSRESFHAYFPALDRFRAFVDPAFSSSFWRRVS